MKKIIALLLFVSALSIQGTAQNYYQGDMNINAGAGLGSYLPGNINVPPVSASFEYGIKDNIGAGIFIGYAQTKETIPLGTGDEIIWDYSHLMIGARGLYHFFSNENMNLYGGTNLGYNIAEAEFSTNNSQLVPDDKPSNEPAFVYSVFAGGHFYFSDNLGLYAEIGYGVSILNVGATLRL